jgi:WD40 repeat protein
MAALERFRRAQEAEYRHGNRKGCLKGTRVAVLDEIELWTRDPSRPPVYWLVRSDPECATESLYNQMRRMIVGPLKKFGISTVIVIDALDECKDEEPESAILSVIGQFASEIPGVKFFLTGRPEPHILQGFGLPEMVKARDVFVLHKVGSGEIGGDMRRFFRHWFADIARRRRGLNDWPITQQLDQLCERAAGLFVYAMATVKFVDGDSPRDRLDLLLRSPESSAREGKTKFGTNTTLDSLYTSILQQSFGDNDPEDDPGVLSVLGAVVLAANPLSPSVIATLLGFDTEAVFFHLSSIHSLLILQEDIDAPVLPFHKSFPDFITDPTRCTNERFHVYPPDHHQELLVECLNLMYRMLEENMCGLPDGIINDEVDDLEEKAYLCIDESLKYACESWHKHLIDEHMARAPEVTSALHRFLEKKFLCWLEVLSVLGSVRGAVDALGAAAKLLEVRRVTRLTHSPNLPRLIQESPTLDLVYDCFQFVTGFFVVIRTSAPHIYHSALPLSPQTSIVRQLYNPRARPLTRIVHGLLASYPSVIANGVSTSVGALRWSPCSKSIAVIRYLRQETIIRILDAVTLEPLTTIKRGSDEVQWLTFSPDSRLLTWFSVTRKEFISWDLRAGVQLSVISSDPVWRSPVEYSSITYSECGTMLGILFMNVEESAISIYNALSGTHTHTHRTGRVLGEVWTHGECIRYATFASGSIIIWEFGFASTHEPTQVESLSTPNDFYPPDVFNRLETLLIHPVLSRFAFTGRKGVLVWDGRESRSLLDSEDLKGPMWMSFSLDGRLFACGTIGPEIYLWKESPAGYVLHRKFQSGSKYPKNCVSPDGRSIVGWDDSGVQVWRTTDPATSLSSISTQTPPRTGIHKVEFSPGGAFAAITQVEDNVVTVLDLESGDPWLVIDTGVKIQGLGVGRSAIVVAGEGRIITWDLPAGNCALGARVNIYDSGRTTTFPQPPLEGLDWKPIISISPDLHRMAIVHGAYGATWRTFGLRLYSVSTGQCIARVSTEWGEMTWLTLGGHDVWCGRDERVAGGWSIVEDSESGMIRLEPIGLSATLSRRLPGKSPCGYEVTGDGWVLSSSRKRLLWLPPYLRSEGTDGARSGRFLAILCPALPEPVLLELPPE